MAEKKLPLFCYILVFIHLAVFGLMPLIAGAILVKFSSDPHLLEVFQERLPQYNIDKSSIDMINPGLIKTAGLVYIIGGLLFLISGSGILFRKRVFVFMALFGYIAMVLLGIMGTLTGQVNFMSFMAFIVFPGIFIFYFTKKDVLTLFE